MGRMHRSVPLYARGTGAPAIRGPFPHMRPLRVMSLGTSCGVLANAECFRRGVMSHALLTIQDYPAAARGLDTIGRRLSPRELGGSACLDDGT